MFITTSQISEPALSQPKRPEQKIFSRNRSFRPALPALTQLTCTDKGQGHGKNRPFSEARLFPTKSTHHQVSEAGRSRTKQNEAEQSLILKQRLALICRIERELKNHGRRCSLIRRPVQ